MAIQITYGASTLSSTLGAGGITPSVTITATLTHTTSYQDVITPRNTVKDTLGVIGLAATRLNATQVRVIADRQLPAGEEIVFDWCQINGSA